MDYKPTYDSQVKKPMSFDDWKGNMAPQFSEETMQSLMRLHGIDYKNEFEEMLKREYAEYCSNLTGSWL